MALDASAAGNVIVKSAAVLVLSPPKSCTKTEASPASVSLNTKQEAAVIVDVDQVVLAKSVNAVVPDVVGVTFVSVLPLVV